MVTYFLGREEVTAYLRDLLQRISQFHAIPNLWCPITPSGDALVRELLPLIGAEHRDWIAKISVLPIQVTTDNKIRFKSRSPAKDIARKRVLLLDTAVHSGSTMSRSVAKVVELGASEVCAYSLMLKCDSSFIPTMWGFMIDKTDRGYFLLPEIPNQRLTAKWEGPQHFVHIEQLSEKDTARPVVKCGVESMDRTTWGDRWFDMASGEQGRSTYLLLKKDEILGYLTIHRPEIGCLMIDEVALSKKHQGKKLGGILLRFADTLARQSDCKFIRLQSISNQVKFYKKFGYYALSEEPIRLNDEKYILMERAILNRLRKTPQFPPKH